MSMDSENRLLSELETLARAWPHERGPGLAARYMETLRALYDTGWDYALGQEREIPDEYLPPHYIARRTAIIDALETDLAELSTRYRGTSDGSPEEARVLAEYARTMEELFRIGHWSGEPDVESQLPHELMPRVYHDYWRARLKR